MLVEQCPSMLTYTVNLCNQVKQANCNHGSICLTLQFKFTARLTTSPPRRLSDCVHLHPPPFALPHSLWHALPSSQFRQFHKYNRKLQITHPRCARSYFTMLQIIPGNKKNKAWPVELLRLRSKAVSSGLVSLVANCRFFFRTLQTNTLHVSARLVWTRVGITNSWTHLCVTVKIFSFIFQVLDIFTGSKQFDDTKRNKPHCGEPRLWQFFLHSSRELITSAIRSWHDKHVAYLLAHWRWLDYQKYPNLVSNDMTFYGSVRLKHRSSVPIPRLNGHFTGLNRFGLGFGKSSRRHLPGFRSCSVTTLSDSIRDLKNVLVCTKQTRSLTSRHL